MQEYFSCNKRYYIKGSKEMILHDFFCDYDNDEAMYASGGELRCNSGKVVVNLSYECLKKANDSKFAREIEFNLSGEVQVNAMTYGWAKRDGVELGGRTVTYDAEGNRTSSCGGMRTANVGNSSLKQYQSSEMTQVKSYFDTNA